MCGLGCSCGNGGLGWVLSGGHLRQAPGRREVNRCRQTKRKGLRSYAQQTQRVAPLNVSSVEMQDDGEGQVLSEKMELIIPPKRSPSLITVETQLTPPGVDEGLPTKSGDQDSDENSIPRTASNIEEAEASVEEVRENITGESSGKVKSKDEEVDEGEDEESSLAEQIRKQGKLAAERGEFLLAKELYRKSVEVDPQLGKGWQNLARMERKLGGSIGDSLSILKEGLKFSPDNSYLWLTCGVLEQERGNPDLARTMFKRGLQRDPTQVAVFVSWARMESIEGNYDTARKLYNEGAKQDPNCERLYHSWAVMESRLGNTSRALELFERGLEIDPMNPYLWHGLGRIAVEQTDYDRAKYCFEKALEQDTMNPVVLHSLGYMELYRLKNYTRARELFTRALAVDPQNNKVLLLFSKLEMHERNFKEAAMYAEKALEIAPRDSMVTAQLAMAKSHLQNYGEARELFKRAIERNPHNLEAFYHWGTMEWRAGNRELSNRLLERCRSAASNFDNFMSELADEIEAAEMEEEARRDGTFVEGNSSGGLDEEDEEEEDDDDDYFTFDLDTERSRENFD